MISDQVGISRDIALDEAGSVTALEPGAIRQALAKLMEDVDLRSSYARKGLACVQRRYEISTVAQQMIEAYRTILHGAGSKVQSETRVV